MTVYAVTLTEVAKNDIADTVAYIAYDLRNLAAANTFLDRIGQAITSLEQMPNRQPLVRDEMLAAQGIRFLTIDHYLLFYRVHEEKKSVTIIRVLYGKQNWKKILI